MGRQQCPEQLPLPTNIKHPSFLLYHHPHSLASLTATFCIEIAKVAHPSAQPHMIQIEVVLDENGGLPSEYLNTNPTGAVSSMLPKKQGQRADSVTRFPPSFVLHPRPRSALASTS
jgi:hypothetical protein